MTLTHFLLLLLPLVSGILPVVEQSRPSTSRLSRGPERPSLSELAARPAAREAVQEAFGSRGRVSVVRFPAADEALPPWAAPEALDVELANALRYSPQWIIDSPITVRRLVKELPAEISPTAAAEIARQLSADQLIFIAIEPLESDAGKCQIAADRWTATADGSWSAADSIRHPLNEASRRTGVSQVAMQLDPSLPSTAHQELAKPGTAENAAHIAWAAAIDHTLQAITSESAEQSQQLAERGLRRAEQSLEADPSFIAASLVAAACLEILGREGEQVDLLRRAYAVRDERRTDLLTMQEFEADYAHLAEGDPDAAFAGYMQLLESDPAHLPATWSLILILSGEDAAELASEDEALLGEFAARILRAHPHSSVAALIAGSKK